MKEDLDQNPMVRRLTRAAAEKGISLDDGISVTGGQAQNELWMQMKSNVLARPLSVGACRDSELIGDAVLAYVGLGRFASIQEGADALCGKGRTFWPEGDSYGVF